MNLQKLYLAYKDASGISTDTRNIQPGNMFFALKGPSFNANEFAATALKNGASVAVIDDEEYLPNKKDDSYILVDDALTALQRLANHHRKQLNIPILAITGTNGKTTTKELLNAVLSTKFKTYATKGNLNNHIGVPLTLLTMGKKVELGIVEMGANKVGDIAELCAIAEPTHGLITNIGKAHLEGFGGFDGVLRAKTEMYHYLIENNGKIFVNSTNPILMNMVKRMKDPFLYPQSLDNYHTYFVSADPFVKFKTANGNVCETKMLGGYNFENIATALAVGNFFGVEEERAVEAVCNYTPSNMRSQLVEKRSNLIVLDAYNANPTSMEGAIKTFGAMTGKKHKMVILGDMYELGEQSEEEHEKLGQLVKEYHFDKVCFAGELTKAALKQAPDALYFPDPFSLRNWLKDMALEDYLILIKGSRGMKMETLVDFI
ncbi:UDP-N-acetylmuramoyl-tripeptide--D-alanyl-D-alanine ligase [Litoribacter alkaliphilus]|uniref:UDP-N-acetylmuramoyl-tripeptide--D-alanyl-D-alanine ligase n=1 Tax=Litoribacter ruber TaxID=702568 RepID=A0AAP2CFF6_9BACT|nr:UDP-N-acetylmuramoyl-tripeptide--D-alanyl-D-alanine ligase [Litoribacter alkaliphilus]MBS9522549.1 UDP-N-acetylmuramoyl-tripeptide--D-alanyl-D-alanine ligase [Litoribacter alkaliphilus]